MSQSLATKALNRAAQMRVPGVDANNQPSGVHQGTARIPRIQWGCVLDNVLDQAAITTAHRTTDW